MTIDELLDQKGFNDTCYDCRYYKSWCEKHPYGATYAYENMAECICEDDSECPRLS